MAQERSIIKESLAKWESKRRPQFVDSEATSFKVFLEEIEIGHCYPENKHLAIKIIEELKKKYSLMF